jgi:hypothetical protein
MTQVIQYSTTKRRSLAAAYLPSDEEIKKEQWRKHIEEISKHLSTEPIQSEDLTYEQKEWLYFRMSRPFPKPYRRFAPIVILYRWQEEDTKA